MNCCIYTVVNVNEWVSEWLRSAVSHARLVVDAGRCHKAWITSMAGLVTIWPSLHQIKRAQFGWRHTHTMLLTLLQTVRTNTAFRHKIHIYLTVHPKRGLFGIAYLGHGFMSSSSYGYSCVFSKHTQPVSHTPSKIPPHPHRIYTKVITKYKAIPGPGRSRRLRLPLISRQSAHEGGTVVSPMHRPPLPPRRYHWSHFC